MDRQHGHVCAANSSLEGLSEDEAIQKTGNSSDR